MRKTIVICCGALLMLGASCQKQQADFKNDDIKMSDVNHLVVNDDSQFTGQVWDENHRMCIDLQDGKKTRLSINHANGQTAAEYDFGTGKSHFYDESGKELTQGEFGKRYRQMILELNNQWNQQESRQ